MNDPIKFFPNSIDGFRRNAIATIFHANADRCGLERGGDGNGSALGTVLDRVAYQIFDDLSDQAAVGGNRWDGLRRLFDETYPLLPRHGLQARDDVANNVIELQWDLQYFLLVFSFKASYGQECIDHT